MIEQSTGRHKYESIICNENILIKKTPYLAKWISLLLQSCGHKFDSRAQFLIIFQFIFELWREKDVNKQKVAGFGQYFKNDKTWLSNFKSVIFRSSCGIFFAV